MVLNRVENTNEKFMKAESFCMKEERIDFVGRDHGT